MNKFRILLGKELRELITPQIILPLVITVIVFLGLGKVIGSQVQKTQKAHELVIVDKDNTAASTIIKDALAASGFTLSEHDSFSSDEAIAAAKADKASSVVIIPAGFSHGLIAGSPQNIATYSIVQNFSIFGAQDYSRLKAGIAAVNEAISTQLISNHTGTDPAFLKNPVHTAETVVVGDKQASAAAEAILGFISSQTTFIPIILFFVITFAAQMIATTIASEKENKTLETLLSLPVKRQYIVATKMLAAGIVAAGASILYLIGMRSYISNLTGSGSSSGVHDAAASLGLILHSSQYVLLGLSLFLAILIALAIALILGAFAEDVRGAQGLVAPMTVLILVPYLLTFFVDTQSLTPLARYAILAIPFSHPFLAGSNLMLGNYAQVWFGIGYQLLWFLALLWVATRIFTTDRIVTLKLSFGKKRKSSV